MNNKTEQLQNVMAYSETMLRDAKMGDWDKVINIETQRSELLQDLFSSTCQGNDIQGMDDKIKKIIEINAQLEIITLIAKDAAHKEISSISKGRKAVDLYAKNSA